MNTVRESCRTARHAGGFRAGIAAIAFATLALSGAASGQMPAPIGPEVWGGYTQNQLDAAYDQNFWDNDPPETGVRGTALSNAVRARFGEPLRVAYGPSSFERLDIYRTHATGPAPIMVFIHGGAWRGGSARGAGSAAEMFMEAGAHYVALDFVNTLQNGGSIMEMAEQVRRAMVWVYNNAASFDGDPNRIYVSGHSSGGHLCGVVMTTNWSDYNYANSLGPASVPQNLVKGGICYSGMYELYPVSLSARRTYVNFTPEAIEQLSPMRHINLLNAPIVIVHGTKESPEFMRQSRDFAAALEEAGKDVTYIVGEGYNHFELPETMANPYGILGRAALQLMGLEPNGANR